MIFCSAIAQIIDLFALFADNHARARRENRHARILGRALNENAADGSVLEFLFQELADLHIFVEHSSEVLSCSHTSATTNHE
jgi:hypothetical protein